MLKRRREADPWLRWCPDALEAPRAALRTNRPRTPATGFSDGRGAAATSARPGDTRSTPGF